MPRAQTRPQRKAKTPDAVKQYLTSLPSGPAGTAQLQKDFPEAYQDAIDAGYKSFAARVSKLCADGHDPLLVTSMALELDSDKTVAKLLGRVPASQGAAQGESLGDDEQDAIDSVLRARGLYGNH